MNYIIITASYKELHDSHSGFEILSSYESLTRQQINISTFSRRYYKWHPYSSIYCDKPKYFIYPNGLKNHLNIYSYTCRSRSSGGRKLHLIIDYKDFVCVKKITADYLIIFACAQIISSDCRVHKSGNTSCMIHFNSPIMYNKELDTRLVALKSMLYAIHTKN
jgi:hypothetical protein